MPGELFVEYQLAAKAERKDLFVAMAAYGDYGPYYIGTAVAYTEGPGLAGALLAFSLSFDDYIITNFNSSPSSITFPMYVWGAAQRGAPVQVNVIGTMMFLVALIVVIIGQVLSSRRERARA